MRGDGSSIISFSCRGKLQVMNRGGTLGELGDAMQGMAGGPQNGGQVVLHSRVLRLAATLQSNNLIPLDSLSPQRPKCAPWTEFSKSGRELRMSRRPILHFPLLDLPDWESARSSKSSVLARRLSKAFWRLDMHCAAC